MKNIALLLFTSLILLSCSGKVSTDDLTKLNGYWEIEKVITPDKAEKEYSVNPTIDFFELKGQSGFRKKVMPQLDGKYLVDDLSEAITISEEKDKFYITYKTNYATWKEEIVALSSDRLVLKNNHDMEYHYKKPIPFTLK
jgi:hypothetical protein